MRLIPTRFLLWLYNSRGANNQERIPLSFPLKVVLISTILALIMGGILGNAFIHSCQGSSMSMQNELKLQLSSSSKTTIDKIGELLPDYKKHFAALTTKELEPLDTLLAGTSIPLDRFTAYINQNLNTKKSSAEIEKDIHGRLIGFPFSIYRRAKITDLMSSYGFSKPVTSKKLSLKEMKYFVVASMITAFRQEHNNLDGMNFTYWLLIAFADYLQWVIFLVAMICAILLFFKVQWSKLQEYVVLNGRFPGQSENQNIWRLDATNQNQLPLFNQFSKQYPNLLLPVVMIEKVLRSNKENGKPVFELFVEEEVALLKQKSEGSYNLINTLYDSCPAWGFIGTIIGATLAFGHASGVLRETEPFFQGEEMNVLTGDLSISFFTTLTGLLAALVLSFILSRTNSEEAGLFQVLEHKSLKELKRYWK